MDSINSGSEVSTTSQSTVTETAGTGQTSEISQGYSGVNSVSSGSGDTQTSTAGDLPQPATVNANAEDLLSRSIEAKLDGFLSAVRQFNLGISPEDVDLNDSDSLLMMLRDMVFNARALASAQNIDQARSDRELVQSSRQSKAKQALVLKARIRERQQNILEKQQQITDRSGTLTEKTLSKTFKEHELGNARASHSDSNDQSGEIARLTVQLQLLDHEIASIQHEVTGLQQDVSSLQALNLTDSGTLRSYQRALDSVTEEFVNVRKVLNQVRQRFDDEALETGEGEKVAVQMEGREAGLEARREERRLKRRSDDNRDLDKTQRRGEIQRADFHQESLLAGTQPPLLPEEDLQLLEDVFARLEPQELQAALERLPDPPGNETERPQPDEGLAIVLQSSVATQTAPAEEMMNPSEQPLMGDNLTLEGTDNPQIFARKWLEAKMAEGEKTQEVKEAQLGDGQENAEQQSELIRQQSELLQRQTLADALQEFQDIPEETREYLDKAQQAKAYISRQSPV